MSRFLDRELNAWVRVRDEDGRYLSVAHVAPSPGSSSEPVDVAIDYLRELAPRLGVRPPGESAGKSFQDAQLLAEGPALRLESAREAHSRLDARRFVQLAFVQTSRGVPVWRSGVSVDLLRTLEGTRVLALRNSVAHESRELDGLPFESLPGYLTPAELEDNATFRALLRENTVRGGGWNDSLSVNVHGAGYRIYRRVSRGGSHAPLTSVDFPLAFATRRLAGFGPRFVVAIEVAFSLTANGHTPSCRAWRVLVAAHDGEIIGLEPLSAHACARAMVLRADPVTLDGRHLHIPTDHLTSLLDEVELPHLIEWNRRAGPLQSELIAIRDHDRIVRAAAEKDALALRFDAGTVEFASICAYYHLSTMFSFVKQIGVPLDALFDGRARPIYVEPWGQRGRVVAQAHPRLERGRVEGIETFTFGDVDVGVDGEAVSNAVDVRLVWHEFAHAILMDTLHQRYLGFAHSFGDGLAALWCDPGTRASDRFATYPWTEIPRRHLRHGDKWSWKSWAPTDDEDRLYDYEQMLSTCLFRLYRVAGGDFGRPHLIIDARETAVRRVASRYVMNLVIRAAYQQASARFSPVATPEQFVHSLRQADDASDGFEEFPPGALRKVIDWAFERQGLELLGPDVHFEDGRGGEYASIDGPHEAAAKLYDEHGWISSAIALDGRGAVSARVGNRGVEAADPVTLRAYRLPLGVGLTWDDVELVHEESLGRVEASSAPRDTGPFALDDGIAREDGIVLELSTPHDESTPGYARAQAPPLWNGIGAPLSLIVPFDNNLSWLARMTLPPGQNLYRRGFVVQNPLSRRARIRLDVQMPHVLAVDGWRLDLPSREVILDPGRRRRVTLVLRRGDTLPAAGCETEAAIRVEGIAELDDGYDEKDRRAWPLGGFEIVIG